MSDIAARSLDFEAQHAKWARGQNLIDAIFRAATFGFAIVVLLLLGGVIVALVDGAWPALHHFGLWNFITSSAWNPVKEDFGAWPAVYGTLVTSAIAMLIGIPSIIYGIWGLFVLAPFLQSSIEPLLIDTLGDLPIIGSLFSGAPLGIGVL